MAHLAKSRRIIKDLTPEQMSQAVAEWVMVRSGVDLSARCRVTSTFHFSRGQREFNRCRVEIELP